MDQNALWPELLVVANQDRFASGPSAVRNVALQHLTGRLGKDDTQRYIL